MLGAAGGGVAFVLDGRLCEVASYADESMDVPREAEHKPSMAFVPMRKTLGPDACATGEAAGRALDYDDVTTEETIDLYLSQNRARAANFESMQARASRRPPTAPRSPPNWRA